jgi:hypothetical protein
MDVLIERCAGLDVHRDTVVATVRRPEQALEQVSGFLRAAYCAGWESGVHQRDIIAVVLSHRKIDV